MIKSHPVCLDEKAIRHLVFGPILLGPSCHGFVIYFTMIYWSISFSWSREQAHHHSTNRLVQISIFNIAVNAICTKSNMSSNILPGGQSWDGVVVPVSSPYFPLSCWSQTSRLLTPAATWRTQNANANILRLKAHVRWISNNTWSSAAILEDWFAWKDFLLLRIDL